MNASPRNRERGSGSALTVALIGGVMAIALLAVPLYMGLATRQAVAGSADAAALAAADIAAGILPGYPCEAAETVASANDTALVACEVDGLVVTVEVSRAILGVPVSARATAGPPPAND